MVGKVVYIAAYGPHKPYISHLGFKDFIMRQCGQPDRQKPA